jgi:Flp pilus assembly protein TadG
VAPVLLGLSLAVFDISRALLVWQQINNGAEAIVEAAEKLSVTTDPKNGQVMSSLTPASMQVAMTTIYAQVPGLNLGVVQGAIYPGSFSVTLSSVAFLPLCNPYATYSPHYIPACTFANNPVQNPVLLWSTYLTKGAGPGSSLNANPTPNPPLRPCADQTVTGAPGPGMQGIAQLPDALPQQFYDMLDPALDPAQLQGGRMILVPQLVADVQYVFTPTFSLIFGSSKSFTFVATAALPAPIGQTNQETTLNPNGGSYDETTNPRACTPQ